MNCCIILTIKCVVMLSLTFVQAISAADAVNWFSSTKGRPSDSMNTHADLAAAKCQSYFDKVASEGFLSLSEEESLAMFQCDFKADRASTVLEAITNQINDGWYDAVPYEPGFYRLSKPGRNDMHLLGTFHKASIGDLESWDTTTEALRDADKLVVERRESISLLLSLQNDLGDELPIDYGLQIRKAEFDEQPTNVQQLDSFDDLDLFHLERIVSDFGKKEKTERYKETISITKDFYAEGAHAAAIKLQLLFSAIAPYPFQSSEDANSKNQLIQDRFISQRNVKWNRILFEGGDVDHGSAFIAVGMAHLFGSDGLLQSAVSNGWRVERVAMSTQKEIGSSVFRLTPEDKAKMLKVVRLVANDVSFRT